MIIQIHNFLTWVTVAVINCVVLYGLWWLHVDYVELTAGIVGLWVTYRGYGPLVVYK